MAAVLSAIVAGAALDFYVTQHENWITQANVSEIQQPLRVSAEEVSSTLTTNMSFTMSDATIFNRGEWAKMQSQLPAPTGALVANPNYDPTYVPRYYTMSPNDPVYIFNKPKIVNGTAKGTYFDPTTLTWRGKELTTSYDLTWLAQGGTY